MVTAVAAGAQANSQRDTSNLITDTWSEGRPSGELPAAVESIFADGAATDAALGERFQSDAKSVAEEIVGYVTGKKTKLNDAHQTFLNDNGGRSGDKYGQLSTEFISSLANPEVELDVFQLKAAFNNPAELIIRVIDHDYSSQGDRITALRSAINIAKGKDNGPGRMYEPHFNAADSESNEGEARRRAEVRSWHATGALSSHIA